MVIEAGPELAQADVVWSRVEDGFHVGSRAGEFVGYIDRQPDGSHVASDMRSRVVGSFADLRAAMAALAEMPPGGNDA